MPVRGELHLLGNSGEEVFSLDEPRFTIGRGPQNSLCLADAALKPARGKGAEKPAPDRKDDKPAADNKAPDKPAADKKQ